MDLLHGPYPVSEWILKSATAEDSVLTIDADNFFKNGNKFSEMTVMLECAITANTKFSGCLTHLDVRLILMVP